MAARERAAHQHVARACVLVSLAALLLPGCRAQESADARVDPAARRDLRSTSRVLERAVQDFRRHDHAFPSQVELSTQDWARPAVLHLRRKATWVTAVDVEDDGLAQGVRVAWFRPFQARVEDGSQETMVSLALGADGRSRVIEGFSYCLTSGDAHRLASSSRSGRSDVVSTGACPQAPRPFRPGP